MDLSVESATHTPLGRTPTADDPRILKTTLLWLVITARDTEGNLHVKSLRRDAVVSISDSTEVTAGPTAILQMATGWKIWVPFSRRRIEQVLEQAHRLYDRPRSPDISYPGAPIAYVGEGSL